MTGPRKKLRRVSPPPNEAVLASQPPQSPHEEWDDPAFDQFDPLLDFHPASSRPQIAKEDSSPPQEDTQPPSAQQSFPSPSPASSASPASPASPVAGSSKRPAQPSAKDHIRGLQSYLVDLEEKVATSHRRRKKAESSLIESETLVEQLRKERDEALKVRDQAIGERDTAIRERNTAREELEKEKEARASLLADKEKTKTLVGALEKIVNK